MSGQYTNLQKDLIETGILPFIPSVETVNSLIPFS